MSSSLITPFFSNTETFLFNFLNYYYTAYKLCELLGESKYLEHFPMLKDPEKRMDTNKPIVKINNKYFLYLLNQCICR